jgi:hypothetical protein
MSHRGQVCDGEETVSPTVAPPQRATRVQSELRVASA